MPLSMTVVHRPVFAAASHVPEHSFHDGPHKRAVITEVHDDDCMHSWQLAVGHGHEHGAWAWCMRCKHIEGMFCVYKGQCFNAQALRPVRPTGLAADFVIVPHSPN